MKVVIIIPTFNERDNIVELVDALQNEFKTISHDMHILVVDDNSPDGTADAVRTMQDRYHNLYLIQGKKIGLGNAYIRGMRYAMSTLRADVIFEMDADLSHRPQDVPRLMSELDAGADLVIGSRYIQGSSIPDQWGLLRRLNSLGGNIAARYIAGILSVKDCTSGFRAIRVSSLRNIDLTNLRVQGYVFQVALLHALILMGAEVKETPIEFVERRHGESKLGFSDIMEFVFNVWWIRLQNSKTFIKFLIVGASGVIVNLGCFSLLLATGFNKYLASPIAIELSIISNFMLNNYWTFRRRQTKDGTSIKGLKFNLVSFLALCINYGTFIILSLSFPATKPQVHQLLGIIPAMLVNYFMNSYWTFRDVQALAKK